MVKVHLILGFLGAGKTTFLKRILRSRRLQEEKVLLIVNDYGPENYDAHILSKEGVEINEITNGCLCCTQTDHFEDTLCSAIQRGDIDRIFIEPSGLFIPDQVLDAFKKDPIKSMAELQPIFTVLDMTFLAGLQRAWPPAIIRHLEICQYIVKNKTDHISVDDMKILDQKINHFSSNQSVEFDKAVDLILSNKEQRIFNTTAKPTKVDPHDIRFQFQEEGLSFKNVKELEDYFIGQSPELIRSKGRVLVNEEPMEVNYTTSGMGLFKADSYEQIGMAHFFMEPKADL